jgi:tetratricopeptide (TPR) repeat protein
MSEPFFPRLRSSAEAAPSPTPPSAAQENLNRSLKALELAEEKKIQDPRAYVQALAYTAGAATQRDRELQKQGGLLYSEEGDRYFKLAADFYAGSKWDKGDSDAIASLLYRALAERSPQVVESTFEEIFKTSERHVEGKFERHDLEIHFSLSQREQKLPLPLQLKLLQRAIEIRRLAQKEETWRIAPLYDDVALAYRNAGDIKGAETNFLCAIAVLEPDPVEQAKAMLNLARFYVDNGIYDKADSTWRRSAALTKQKRLVWRASEYVMLIQTYINRQKPKYLPPLFDLLITNGDEFTFVSLDPMLVDYIDKQIKLGELETAAGLLKKRIEASSYHGVKPGSESWKIKLSNIYLAQGKTTESLTLFKQAISALERGALPTSDYIDARAKLLENMGLPNDTKNLTAILPENSMDIRLPACMVVKDIIEFGKESSITSFDSSDSNDPTLRFRGGGSGVMRSIPPSGDGSSILCLGSISGTDIRYFGSIYCNNSKLTQLQNSRAKIMPLEHAFQIPEGLDPPIGAKTGVPVIEAGVRMLERGDYILTDLSDLSIREQTSSVPIRIFLEDSPEKSEYILSIHGPPLSYKQFQVWYKGTKTIKLNRAQGLIYAPNARLELTSGTGFMGAIVAKEFKSSNNSSVWLDRGMLNKNLTR